jgi:hypothetical protein
MKIHRILGLAGAVIIVRLAPAKLPFSNDAFGKIEGTYDFCAQANPQAAAKYQERKKAMAGNTPEQEVAEARSTKEYKDGYQWMSSELGKVPKNKAVAACKASLEDN